MIQHIIDTQIKIYEAIDKTIGVFIVPEFEYYYIYAQNEVPLNEYKKALTKLLDVAGKEYPFNKIVMSLGDMISTPMIGRAWFAAYFAPTIYKQVNRDMIAAVVKPQNKFEAVTIDIISGSLPKMGINLKVQFFEDKYAAIKWIENPIFE